MGVNLLAGLKIVPALWGAVEDALHLWLTCLATQSLWVGRDSTRGPISWSPTRLCRFLRVPLIALLMDRDVVVARRVWRSLDGETTGNSDVGAQSGDQLWQHWCMGKLFGKSYHVLF